MATGHERLRVTVLTGEANWASWKVQMRHQLRSRKLWNIVKGEEKLAASAEQGEKTAFEERCIEATMRLTFAMSPAVVLLVQSLDCPVKIWDRLERQYEKRTASKLSLVQRYFGAKMAEGESAEKHLLGMNELCDRLAAMELPVPEEFQPLMILASLPASYTAIVQTLGSQARKLDMAHVTSTVLDEDARRKENGSQENQALVSHGGRQSRNSARRDLSRVQCYNCRECPDPPKQHNPAALTHRGGNQTKTSKQSSLRKPSYKSRVAVLSDEEDPDAFCFCTGPQKGMKAEEWVVDSGATTHMTWDKGVFVTFAAMEDMPNVRLGDGRTVKAEGKGIVCLRIKDDKEAERVIRLSSVLFVPDLSCNLFSVQDITDKGNRMMFDDITCSVITRGDVVIASGHKRGNLYVLDGTADRQPDEAQPSSDLWHQRLAHVNNKMLDKLVSCDVSGVDLKKVEPRSFCEGCGQGKATRHKPKPLGEIRSTRRLEKVHSDVCGPMQMASNSGKKYMVTFVDEYSRSCAVYFMAHKSDTFAMFQEFHAKVTGESGERIGVLKTDGGGEYRSREFAQYLRKHQIEHEVTVPDSPEMTGLAERMNRTILEKAKCICAHADVLRSLSAEATSTACYVYNRLPNAPLKCKSPYEVWYSRKPDLSNLRVFGCVAYALVPAAKRKKFDNRTEKMRFLGYHRGHRGYKLMEKGSNRVFYRTDVTFDESNFKLTEEKPVTGRRRLDETTVEVVVGCSGSCAGLPVELPVDVPAVEQEEEDVSEQRENPKAVAVPREREEMPVAEHQRPIRNRKQTVRLG